VRHRDRHLSFAQAALVKHLTGAKLPAGEV